MDQLSLTFHALSDPTRRAILMRLASGDATVNELAEPFDLRLPTVSKHLKVLQEASLVSQTREAQRRHCHLEAKALKEVADWVWSYRTHWEESFDRLNAFLGDIEAAGKASKN
ncbi:transcriptional regulator [Mesorhizobium loti]|nr:metalloregulator ArsR/SmtB family transcription factor [Mesorhizobium loti]PLP56382.1 transcriptional regulator [Mesorhizobium loti]